MTLEPLAAQREHQRVGGVAIDIADKAQRHVQLCIALPARAGERMHGGEQAAADLHRRDKSKEQAHG